jgi:hypothetical protein
VACQSICIDTVRESVCIVGELVGLNLIPHGRSVHEWDMTIADFIMWTKIEFPALYCFTSCGTDEHSNMLLCCSGGTALTV